MGTEYAVSVRAESIYSICGDDIYSICGDRIYSVCGDSIYNICGDNLLFFGVDDIYIVCVEIYTCICGDRIYNECVNKIHIVLIVVTIYAGFVRTQSKVIVGDRIYCVFGHRIHVCGDNIFTVVIVYVTSVSVWGHYI